jgi:hypothetical protein
MIKIGIGLGSRYFTSVSGGTQPPASAPASLTITFGQGVEADDVIYLTINGVQNTVSLGYQGSGWNVSIWGYDGEDLRLFSGLEIATEFSQYIQTTFSSSLTVSRVNNVVTLTTIATQGASLTASCGLPIFPNRPLTVTPAPSYAIQLGYDENQDYSACFAGQGTYYSNTLSLQVESLLYFDSQMTLIAPYGYYSDTVNLYTIDFLGKVTNRVNGFCNL